MPWGEAVDIAVLQDRLAATYYRAVIAIHNESSTGAVTDLSAIGAAVRETDALLIFDSVSGLGGIEMQQDRWGVDVLVSASQKALMCPPGLGLVSVSEKAWWVIDSDAPRARYYWDFRKARDNAAEGQTAFTPAVSLAYGLQEALRMIGEEGLPNVLDRHARHAAALQSGARALGLRSSRQHLSAPTRSPCCSCRKAGKPAPSCGISMKNTAPSLRAQGTSCAAP